MSNIITLNEFYHTRLKMFANEFCQHKLADY